VQVVRSGSLKTTYIIEELFERQTPTVLKDLTGVVTDGGCIVVGTVGSGIGCDWTILSWADAAIVVEKPDPSL